MQFRSFFFALVIAASSAPAAAQPDPAASAMPRDVIEAGIQQIGKACVGQWSAQHGETKATAFCDCVNADDVTAIRRVKTVGDMDRWVLSANEEAKRHEAGDPKVTALFQQRFERCEPALK